MSLIEQFIQRAKQAPKRVVLPEGDDERMIQAAVRLVAEGIAKPIVLGAEEEVRALAGGASLAGVTIVDPAKDSRIGAYSAAYAKNRGVAEGLAGRMVKRPLYFGGMMVAEGDADAMVAGVAKATAQVISAAALTVGFSEGVSQASSYFVMVLPDGKVLVFADCAVVVDPNARELAEIAVTTARNAKKLLDVEPRVAMLSFSTKGSAQHAHVDKVREATAIAKEMAPEILLDGEFQVDSAIVERVAKKKCPDSTVGGTANVLVFPDLDSGNMGYKLTQYLGNAKAIGPIMQGFAKPVNDLSRGASVDDIIAVTAIASLQCGG
ncbi:MAG: phosphate acetyltransferase [Candidatus Sumerlaeia bacterium]|nr:phosphate acetyltransferase [Candidatus Sumerlaeia bacterium]